MCPYSLHSHVELAFTYTNLVMGVVIFAMFGHNVKVLGFRFSVSNLGFGI
jgi:hypothetical protein